MASALHIVCPHCDTINRVPQDKLGAGGPWCGPCRAMAPEFERAAAQLEPALRLVKVNVDEEPALAQRFRISGIPALVLALHGRELARTAGARSAAQLVEWARAQLARAA